MITIQNCMEGEDEKVRVTFAMPEVTGCGCLYLVGWFSEWGESVYRMQHTDDGMWVLTLELELGCQYHYCFRTNDGAWLYDPDIPRAPDPFGSKNSFVISRGGLGD